MITSLTGVMPKPLVSRILLRFSHFTARDWLELITTGAVYGLLETAPAHTLWMMKKLREAIEILLRRWEFSMASLHALPSSIAGFSRENISRPRVCAISHPSKVAIGVFNELSNIRELKSSSVGTRVTVYNNF